MSKWRRAAQINKNLIIGLVVLILAAGIFWAIKWRSSASDKAQVATGFQRSEYKLTCSNCKETFTIPAAEAQQIDKDRKEGKVKCPKCGTYTAQFGPGGTGGVQKVDETP